MAEEPRSNNNTGKATVEQFQTAAPQLNMPKGGGAIRGIGEKFAANPVTGTGSCGADLHQPRPLRVRSAALAVLRLRCGNGLSVSAGASSLPSITRKTDKGLAAIRGCGGIGHFILSGAEDLVPALLRSATNGYAISLQRARCTVRST